MLFWHLGLSDYPQLRLDLSSVSLLALWSARTATIIRIPALPFATVMCGGFRLLRVLSLSIAVSDTVFARYYVMHFCIATKCLQISAGPY